MTTLPKIYFESLYWDETQPNKVRLTRDVKATLSNGDEIKIPRNYITDFRSAPKNILTRALVNAIVNQLGNHNFAVVVHDWLYDNQLYDRKFADKEMLHWLLLSKCGKKKAYLMYWACRLAAKKWWNTESKPELELA